MSSPFDDYANATLRFPVATDVLDIDPKTGNVSAQTAIVTVAAMLKEKKNSAQSEELPGIDRASIRLEGRAIEPLAMPSIIAPYTSAEAVWQGHKGEFVLFPGGQSPYGTAEILGDKISGLFRISDFVVDGDPYVPPTPTPTPTPIPSDGNSIKIAFSFGDASPKPIAQIAAGRTVFTAQVVIQTPFNGVGAALSVGDAGIGDRLLRSNQTDPTFAAEYETNPAHTYSSDTQILLAITPGAGCTSGTGFVLLEIG